jgi:hypothetical protein
MGTLQEDAERLREAWLDVLYEVGKAWGLIRFLEWRGAKLKPWVRERQIRDRWPSS